MKYLDFINSIEKEKPPKKIPKIELSIWYILKNNWDMAHTIAQDIPSEIASWIHAYLHRQEGDISNAHYWYSKANKVPYSDSLEEELDDIIESIFEKS